MGRRGLGGTGSRSPGSPHRVQGVSSHGPGGVRLREGAQQMQASLLPDFLPSQGGGGGLEWSPGQPQLEEQAFCREFGGLTAQPVAWRRCWQSLEGMPRRRAIGPLACSPRSASPGPPLGPWSEPGDLSWMSHTAYPAGLGKLLPPETELRQPGVKVTPAVLSRGRSTAICGRCIFGAVSPSTLLPNP